MPFLACENFARLSDVIDHEACTLDAEADVDLIEGALAAASDILYVLSGGRVTGRCSKTFRPLRRFGGCGGGVDYADPWYAIYGVDVIPLADNLLSVEQLKIDGVIQALSTYGLIDNRYLFLREGVWPGSNDLRLHDTEVGTWSITVAFGYMPDWLATAATTEIALQLITDDRRGGTYLRGITSANVQGASVAIDRAAANMANHDMPQLSRFLSVHAPNGGYPVGIFDSTLENGWVLAEVEGPSGS